MSRILILDNYDSFTFNLVHLIEKVSVLEFDVFRNDEIALEQVAEYDKILLSPGPGLPKDAGIMPELLQKYASHKDILGVCLGLQAIGESFGAKLKNLEQVYHGVSTAINVNTDDMLFKNCPNEFKVGRYHSWVVDESTIPSDLEVTAKDILGNIMALRHKDLKVCGVQFHPESILSECGEMILKNWLDK